SGQAEIVNGIREDPRAIQMPGAADSDVSLMLAPLMERDRVIGVLTVRRAGTERPFQPAELELLKAFASMAASAVSNARLFDETQRRLRELETMQNVSAALRLAQTPEEMFPIFIEHACQIANGKAGSIFLLEEPSGDWVSQGWIDAAGRWINATGDLRHRPNEGVTGRVGATGEIYVTDDWRADPIAAALPGEADLLGRLAGGISLPLRAETRAIGVIHIWRADVHPFTEAERRMLSAIADMAGNALQRARLHQETGRQVSRLAALHAIDMAISGSLDLRLTLDLLLENVTMQPGVDAADVLLFRPSLNIL
ncbi:MAG: GAF domain-containing protein, partial [Chloroflexota bacterium]